jgi:O-antigen/teichoic acid export membrane protein
LDGDIPQFDRWRSFFCAFRSEVCPLNRRILFAGAASWLSRAVGVLLGLALMPILFRRLSHEELGVWLLLAESCAVLGVFDFGFGVILTRRIAFAVGKSSLGAGAGWSGETRDEIANLVALGRRVYCWLAAGGFLISFGLGWLYLRRLELGAVSPVTIWLSWGVLCLSQAFGIWAAVWTCALQGVGYVGWDSLLGTGVRSLTLLGQIVLACLGTGVAGLALAAAAGALIQRTLIIRFARRRRPELFAAGGPGSRELFREMVAPALRAWLTSIGYLLVANTDQLFIASQKGASAIPSYRAAFLLAINLHLLAGVFCAPSQVFVSQLWQSGELPQIQAILRRNARIGLLAMGCGAGAILALGPVLFELWLGPGNFVGYPVLAIFLTQFVLEHHANVFSSCARATQDEAYAISSLLAGVLKVGLALALSSRLGLVGLALSTLMAQGLTNGWFMVYRSVQRLHVDFQRHCHQVILPCLLLFLATLALGRWTVCFCSAQTPWVRVLAVSILAGLMLAASLWHMALEKSQRRRVLRWAGFA